MVITQLPETAAGHTAIVVFVDRLSKMVLLVGTHWVRRSLHNSLCGRFLPSMAFPERSSVIEVLSSPLTSSGKSLGSLV